MFSAYIDDSASELGDRRFYLCAYILPALKWEKFSEDWDAALNSKPSIRHLHMVDAWAFRGEFDGWCEADRNKKLVAMANVIKKHKPFAVEISLSQKVFDETFKKIAPFFLKKPYFVCFYGMIITVARLHSDWKLSVPVDFIFDETTASADTVMFYEYVKSNFPQFSTILGNSPVFKDDELVAPLQAADMLAWYVRRRNEGRKEHIPGGHLLRDMFAVIEMSEASLKDMAAKMEREVGIHLIQTKKDWRRIKPSILHQISTRTWPKVGKHHLFKRFFKWLARIMRF